LKRQTHTNFERLREGIPVAVIAIVVATIAAYFGAFYLALSISAEPT
jgi:hypothetical protein